MRVKTLLEVFNKQGTILLGKNTRIQNRTLLYPFKKWKMCSTEVF